MESLVSGVGQKILALPEPLKTQLLRRAMSQPGNSSSFQINFQNTASFSSPSTGLTTKFSPASSGVPTSSFASNLVKTLSGASSSSSSSMEVDDGAAVESLLMLSGQKASNDQQDADGNELMADEVDGCMPTEEWPSGLLEGSSQDATSQSSSMALLSLAKSESSGHQRGSAEHSVNYYQRMRMRNNEASKRCRLKRRIKQESLEKTRLLLDRHRQILRNRMDRLTTAKNLLTQAYHHAQDMKTRGDGQCGCLLFCNQIADIKDAIPEKSDVSNEQLIRESKYVRETNLEDILGEEIVQNKKPLRRGPRKMDDFDPSIFEQLIPVPSHRDSRGLSESQSSTGSGSGSGSGSAEEGSGISDRVYGMPNLTPIKRDHSRLSGGGESSDDIEVLGFKDRSNIGALDLSNPKRKFTKLASPMTSPTTSSQLLVQPLLSPPNQQETIPPRPLHRKVVSAPKRLGQPISLGPRDSPLTLRDIKPVFSTMSPMDSSSASTVQSSSLPSLAPKPLKSSLQSREGLNGGNNLSELPTFGPTTIIVTPLTSSFSPTYLTIPYNRSFSMPSATITSSSSVTNTSTLSSLANTSTPSSNMPTIKHSTLASLSTDISPVPPSASSPIYTSIAAPRPTVLSPPLISSPLASPTLGRYIKTEPETIIKTELDDPDLLDGNNSQSTIESSQASTQLMSSQASTQPMDDDDEFDQPPLTISTDEVDGAESHDEGVPEVPKCAAMSTSTSCAGTLMALNQLNQTLDLKTMVPGPPGPHTTAEKYIIMSRLKLPYWEADEKLSWICLKHRTDIVHTTDSSTCAFCPKSKKSSGPIYVVSYRICLEYYMSEGKFLDIGRGICQACRIKTFKNLDFHDCPVVIPTELMDEGQSSYSGLQSSVLQQASYSGLQQPASQNSRLPARDEKPISLPLNPIKIKSLAAIQPVLNSTKSFPPMRSNARNIQQIRNETRSIQPIRSEARSVQPMRSEGRSIQPIRSESRSIQPMRSETQSVQPTRNLARFNETTHNDNVRNKINDLNSAIHSLNPSYRPLGFSITKLSDLGPSTLSETLTATQIAMETILSSVAPGQEGELWEAVLPFITTKLINKQ